jgi:hypothetical protein
MNHDEEMNQNQATAPDASSERRENGPNSETNHSSERPYGDAGNLYEIPRIRPEDPPLRRWWTDDEPQGNDSHQ